MIDALTWEIDHLNPAWIDMAAVMVCNNAQVPNAEVGSYRLLGMPCGTITINSYTDRNLPWVRLGCWW